jgi:DNA-directed RNA polymerase specialized sigma24 family protein
VETALSGDKEAFSEIVKRCQDMAYGIAHAMLRDTGLAQDAALEAFIAAYFAGECDDMPRRLSTFVGTLDDAREKPNRQHERGSTQELGGA